MSSRDVDGLNIEGKMIFSNYCRYSRELALNPKDGEEKCLAEMVFGSKFAPTMLGKRTAPVNAGLDACVEVALRLESDSGHSLAPTF